MYAENKKAWEKLGFLVQRRTALRSGPNAPALRPRAPTVRRTVYA
jgi:hypothetical protein